MSGDSADPDIGQPSEEELIERARAGDALAGRELLRRISLGLSRGDLHPQLAAYHADCLWNHVHLGISLERALHVYKYQINPTAYDPIELAAVYELLLEFTDMKKGEAKAWIRSHIGASKKTTENAMAAVNIKALDAFDIGGEAQAGSEEYRRERYLDLLLHTAGSMRKIVAGVVAPR
jgi:transcriptional antiterminator Rof (Rho-off)